MESSKDLSPFSKKKNHKINKKYSITENKISCLNSKIKSIEYLFNHYLKVSLY